MSLRRLSQVPPSPGALTPLGAYNCVISLWQTGAKNSDGTTQPPGLFMAGIWAACRALAARETDKQQQIEQKVSHEFTLAFFQGLTEDMLITFVEDGITRTFQIVGIKDVDERREELSISAAEVGQSAQ